MKKIIIFIVIEIITINLSAQFIAGDSLLNVIITSKVDSVKIKAALDLSFNYVSYDVDTILHYSQKILEIGLKENNKNLEGLGYAEMANAFNRMSDKAKGIELALKALNIAEPINNARVLSWIYVNTAEFYEPSDRRGIDLGFKSLDLSGSVGDNIGMYRAFLTLGRIYIATGKNDSALMYVQQAYELMTRFHFIGLSNFTMISLSRIHLALGYPDIALAFLRKVIINAKQNKLSSALQAAYGIMAEYYQKVGNSDSTFHYVKKMYATSITGKIGVIIPAMRLYEIFKVRGNSDSALKYLEIAKASGDSLNSSNNIQKLQSLRVQEDLRQKELAIEKQQAKEKRSHNLQYAAIVIGLIIFIILFSILSRSIIVKTKFIEFFGVLGLLAVFEFINLFIHPYLAHITNDSPVLMLLILIGIGALLVPLHHRLEKWMTKVMVEKNKKIRLAAARKTIEQLEGKSDI